MQRKVLTIILKEDDPQKAFDYVKLIIGKIKNNELDVLNSDKKVIESNVLTIQQTSGIYFDIPLTYNNSAFTNTQELLSSHNYAVLCNISSNTNLSISVSNSCQVLFSCIGLREHSSIYKVY